MALLKSFVLFLSSFLLIFPAVYAHEPGNEEPARPSIHMAGGPEPQDPAQIELVREEPPQDDTTLSLMREARMRCLDLATQSAGNMIPAGQTNADDAAWMADCAVNAFTDLMVENMHGFILFQGTEIYRHCTTGERGGRMDNFGECMQPFDILIERVSAPCREAFGPETGTAHACIKLFNEKMLRRVDRMAADKKEPATVNLNELWYTLGAALLISGGMFLVYKRL